MKAVFLFISALMILSSCEPSKKCSAYPKSPRKNIYSPSHNY